MSYSINIVQRKTLKQQYQEEWKKECKRISRMNAIVTWFFIGLTIGITPCAFIYADSYRGYDSLGGEVFIPLFGVLLIVLVNDLFRQYRNYIKFTLLERYRQDLYKGRC